MKQTYAPLADAALWSGANAANNYGGSPALRVGTIGALPYRTVLAFALSDVPPAATVTRADLVLTVTSGSLPAPLEILGRRVTASWTEAGVSWLSRDGVTAWTDPGGDISAEIVARARVAAGDAHVTLDARLLVTDALERRAGACLLLLSGPEIAPSGNVNFGSRESPNPPRLEVEYYVPAPPPEGPQMVPLAKLRDMLAATPATQARFGVAGDDAHARARERIYFPVLADEEIPARLPAIVVTDGDEWQYTQHSGGAQNYLRPAGTAVVLFAARSRYPGDLEAGRRDFSNWVGLTLQQLAGQAGVDTLLSIREIAQEMPPAMCSREHEDAFGLYFLASYAVRWD